MLFEDFKKILDEQYGVIELKIQGMGEPFLGKDFIRMVEYTTSKDIWVRTSTNATLLNRDENYKKVIDAGVDELQISIDGTTKHTYENIRINARFETVVENCKLINGYCDSLGIDRTRMWVLLQKENLKELHQFPSFANELGFKRVAIIMDIHGWSREK
jgi:pyrroloquinoline quinone biosynthesis protein E